jgi:hypothetical protein
VKRLQPPAVSGLVSHLISVPISPLDGGRIVAVLGPRMWLIGVPLLVALFAYSPSPMLLVIAVLTAPRILQALRYNGNAPENRTYYAIPAGKRFEYRAIYLGMVVTLSIVAYQVHANLTSGNLPNVWYPRSGA